MTTQKYLITGGLGCLGAWIIRNLVQSGIQTVSFDINDDLHRLALIMEPEEIEQVHFVQGDITDTVEFKRVILENEITQIIHLAALQVPFCKANPPLGAAVNVVGTVNVFEAAKAAGIQKVIYASSIAIYGGKQEYQEELLSHHAISNPHTHYGVFKRANEGTAHIYWQDEGISSIGLRPYTLYGPGRDQGLTSAPTQAMLAAARGERYHITYGGYNGFQYNDDVAKIFIRAAQIPYHGADVFNIKGSVTHMKEVIQAIESAKPEIKGMISFDDNELSFPYGTEDQQLRELLGEIPDTPLRDGVAQTIAHFDRAIAEGLLPEKPEQL